MRFARAQEKNTEQRKSIDLVGFVVISICFHTNQSILSQVAVTPMLNGANKNWKCFFLHKQATGWCVLLLFVIVMARCRNQYVQNTFDQRFGGTLVGTQ